MTADQLLDWLNELLDLRYTSLEQCSDGIAYGQLLEALFPGCVTHRGLRFLVMDPSDQQENHEYIANLLHKVPIRTCMLRAAHGARHYLSR